MELSPEIEAQIDAVGSADVVVGVPSYNNARTIARVLEAVRDGLTKHLGHARAVVVNSDAGSTDGTPDAIAAAAWDLPRVLARHHASAAERMAVPFHGIPGRSAAQRTIVEVARRVRARASAILVPDCRSPAPDWMDLLLRPVLEEGYDYVAPLWERRRYDGTLTSAVIYPLVRALYGKRVRQPLGGPRALSGRLVVHLCDEGAQRPGAARQDLDLWMLATAATERFAMCEAWLGPFVVESEGYPADLATVVAQAIGATFGVLEETAEVWADIRGTEPIPTVGTPLPPGPGPAGLDVDRMIRAFRLGLKDLLPLWEQVLASDTLAEVMALEGGETVRFSHDLWARVVYDFALGYRFRTIYRDHLLRSLVPLYLGRTGAFVRETWRASARDTEAWIERGCAAFERQKPYLAERWR